MIKDLVSIIIPVYNRQDLISFTINSILKQTYSNLECIIIDDGSTDNTFSLIDNIVKIDNRVKCFTRPKSLKKGANSCRNYGFTLAKGKYVTWFDSDDIMPVDSVEVRVSKIQYSTFDFVIGYVHKFENIILIENQHFIAEHSNLEISASNYLTGESWFHTSAPLFNKEYLLSYNYLFDTDLKFHDETELFTRLLLEKPNVGIVNKITTMRRMHSTSIYGRLKKFKYSDKLLEEYPGYIKIFHHFFKDKKNITKELLDFYKFLFYEWIFKIEGHFFLKFILFFKGYKFSLFDKKNNLFKKFIYLQFYSLFKRIKLFLV
jgi:glycosyltransferase involved in cell wall biosynthesis